MSCNNKICKPGCFPYKIRRGDTLYSISVKFSTSVKRLLELNPEVEVYNLQIGSTICVPLTAQYYPYCRTTNYYVVQENDTLYSISRYFGVSVNQILYHNIGVDEKNIYRGLILCIPIAPSPAQIVVTDGKLFVKFDNGDEVSFDALYPPEKLNSYVIRKRLDNPVGGSKWLDLSERDISICGERARCSRRSIILSDKDMDTLFNLIPIGTEVSIL